MDNYDLITKGFRIVRDSMVAYIARELIAEYGQNWWESAGYNRLFDEQKKNLPATGNFVTVTDALDMANCLTLFDIHWKETFGKKLSRDYRTWANELHGVRNRWAHAGGNTFGDSDTWRALDTMSRLLGGIDPDGEAEINELMRDVRYGNPASGSEGESSGPKKNSGRQTVSVDGLPAWKDVMEPHQDVREGRYRNAEFAADLAQVSRGEGSFEYRDPVEFYRRTYVTEGMKGLLTQALRRVGGLDGEPVIQLKTAFGGGKTHSMLALYHLLRSSNRIDRIPNAAEVVRESGIGTLPEVRVAVLVGTSLNPTKYRRPADMPGITISTLWGEMAAQLAFAAGNPGLYDHVRDADRKGVSPGSQAIKELFDACGPCLVLMDELVAYAKKLYGVSGLPAGSFDNFITFIQEVTEAARASKNSMVVASIPESDIEIGGDAGQQALEAIEHTFGRMEAIWKPVTANEGFEVVRRRLFLGCKDEQKRDAVCNAFSQMYGANAADFPVDAKELEYRDRLVSCYPIHPEVFDRLYEDWATLERFQRTRGVLRLMAAVIHELWMAGDQSPMIMPGSMPLDVPNVRDELTRYLDENWNGVVDSEVDGKRSVPFKLDQRNGRYGRLMAARRVARTVMLGSAPDVSGQSARGIERSHIRLGVVQPGESIATFNDALGTLQGSSSFLYSDGQGNRWWYDTRPTLRKVMEDRAQQFSKPDVEYELEQRLSKWRKCPPFQGLHVYKGSSLDIPDDQVLHLVVLPPNAAHRGNQATSAAIETASAILSMHGTTPRQFKNMLAFVACDGSSAGSLDKAARVWLAWKSISDDREALNLDMVQQRETDQSMRRAEETLKASIQEAYSWLLAPRIDLLSGNMDIEWEIDRIAGSGEDAPHKAARKLLSNEAAIEKWAPALLQMELDKLLWKDSQDIQIKRLWDLLCTYCYLPRLANYSVLEGAISQGLASDEFFGIADGVGDNGYLNLTLGKSKAFINKSDYLVKPNVVQEQIKREEEAKAEAERRRREREQGGGGSTTTQTGDDSTGGSGQGDGSGTGGSGGDTSSGNGGGTGGEQLQLPLSFTMSAKLDNTRVNRDVRTIMDEIVSQLMQLDGADVDLHFEVHARVDEGIPVQTSRALTENCNTLHIGDYRFDG